MASLSNLHAQISFLPMISKKKHFFFYWGCKNKSTQASRSSQHGHQWPSFCPKLPAMCFLNPPHLSCPLICNTPGVCLQAWPNLLQFSSTVVFGFQLLSSHPQCPSSQREALGGYSSPTLRGSPFSPKSRTKFSPWHLNPFHTLAWLSFWPSLVFYVLISVRHSHTPFHQTLCAFASSVLVTWRPLLSIEIWSVPQAVSQTWPASQSLPGSTNAIFTHLFSHSFTHSCKYSLSTTEVHFPA